ncbi:hypothetical protein MOUN0_O07338 [Monosporozyma unispora]|nr:hypothetical protein C6P44_001859 [Kazachstania unispora]
MHAINLNLKPTTINSPKPVYKRQSRLKEYSTKVPLSNIDSRDENFELVDLYINREIDNFSVSSPSPIPPAIQNNSPRVLSQSSQLLKSSPVSPLKNQIKVESKTNKLFHQKSSFVNVSQPQHIVIDLSSLRKLIGEQNLNFDCGPLRNVYNYESQFDQSGAVERLINKTQDGLQIMFPEELEYQERAENISWIDKILYYLFGIDKDQFFELSSKRDQFYNFTVVSLTQPIDYPIDYDDEYVSTEEEEEEDFESNYFIQSNDSWSELV